jgi:uncharacterized small protein (DUF1192 family)
MQKAMPNISETQDRYSGQNWPFTNISESYPVNHETHSDPAKLFVSRMSEFFRRNQDGYSQTDACELSAFLYEFFAALNIESQLVRDSCLTIMAALANRDAERQAEIERLRASSNERVAELQADNERLRASSNEQVAELQAEIERLRASSNERVAELQAEIERLRAKLDSATTEAPRTETSDLEAKLQAEVSRLRAELKEATETIEDLLVKLNQPKADDTNSGVPGSKVMGGRKSKPKPDTNGSPRRTKGGQKGHKGSNRKPAPPEDVAESETYEPESTNCPKCGTPMVKASEYDSIYQQFETLEKLLRIVEARGAAYVCPHCDTKVKGKVPAEIRNRSLFGPRLLSFIISLRFYCNASIRSIAKFLNDTFNVRASIGCLAESIIKASICLAESYKEIEEAIRNQPVVYVDETPHLENGRQCYTWVFVTGMAIFFAIGNRSRDMLERVLKEDFTGIICSDYYGVYISYVRSNENVRHQTCLAHLKREFKRCADHILDREISQYGEKMLKLLEALLKARDDFNEAKTPEALECFRNAAKDFNREGALAPNKGQPARLAKRFASSDSYTTFVEHPEVDATNNRSERAIRKVVIQRAVTQGTRSERGRLASERFWTVKATCELHNISFLEYFIKCYEAHLKGEPKPSIVALE